MRTPLRPGARRENPAREAEGGGPRMWGEARAGVGEGGPPGLGGAARDRPRGGPAGGEERRQPVLRDQRGAPRRADVEPVVPGPHRAGGESDLARADLGALDAAPLTLAA